MKEKSIWWLLGGAVAGFVVLCAAFLTGMTMLGAKRDAAENRIEQGYVAELWELRDNLNDMENVSAKLIVAGGAEDTAMYACDLKRGAEAAAIAAGKLPIEGDAVGVLNKVSDFASSMLQTAVSGRSTRDFSMRAEDVYVIVRTLNSEVETALSDVEEGRKRVSDGLRFGGSVSGDKEDNSVEYPELIYDGPFSDARKDPCFYGLENLGTMTEAEAKLKFAETFGLTNVELIGMSSTPEAYELSGKLGLVDVYASISVRGGMVLNLIVNKSPSVVRLSETEAERLAVEYAERLGYENMIPVWYNASEGVAYVNLAPEANGAILYTDLVKVKIALDDGTVMGLEALGYCTAHRARDYKPTIDEVTAKSLVSKQLKVTSIRLCVVPDGDEEALCYEVAGSYKDLDYFVYLSAYDGHEVNILRVIDDNQGKLTV